MKLHGSLINATLYQIWRQKSDDRLAEEGQCPRRDAANGEKILRKYKYPPEGLEDAVKTVIAQCER